MKIKAKGGDPIGTLTNLNEQTTSPSVFSCSKQFQPFVGRH